MSASNSRYVDESSECDSTQTESSTLVTGQNAIPTSVSVRQEPRPYTNLPNSENQSPSELLPEQTMSPHADHEWTSQGRNSTYYRTRSEPIQEMESYNNESGLRSSCAFVPPPRREHSAPVNEYTSRRETRMLKFPTSQAQFDQNKMVMKIFFDEFLVRLSEQDICCFGTKLLDCEYGKLISETNITVGSICVHTLVSGMFDRWIRRTGWKADLLQVRCILEEMKHISMCDSLDSYIMEQSNEFVSH